MPLEFRDTSADLCAGDITEPITQRESIAISEPNAEAQPKSFAEPEPIAKPERITQSKRFAKPVAKSLAEPERHTYFATN